MRHRRSGRKFNRDTKARAALLRALSMSLIRDGKVVTTHQKAKELQRLTDKLLTTARKQNTLEARRQLQAFFGKRDVANTLVDRYVPLLAAYQSGVTKLTVLGPRAGDNAVLAQVDWAAAVGQVGLANPQPTVVSKSASSTKKKAAVTKKPAAPSSAKKSDKKSATA